MALLIVADKAGRLGNRAILFAHLIAFAEEYHLTVFNPAFDDYSHMFAGTAGGAVSRYPQWNGGPSAKQAVPVNALFQTANVTGRALRRLRLDNRIWSVHSAGYVEETDGDVNLDEERHRRKLLHSRMALLFGFRFRCYKLFAQHEETIRTFFAPSGNIAETVDSAVARLRENVDCLVGVHIRQGDYREFLGGRLFFALEHYANVMRTFYDLLPEKKIRFVICSDEQVDLTRFPGLDVARGPGDVGSEFFTLSRCDYLIATKSTFSRWASFLGRVPLFTITESTPALTNIQDLRPATH